MANATNMRIAGPSFPVPPRAYVQRRVVGLSCKLVEDVPSVASVTQLPGHPGPSLPAEPQKRRFILVQYVATGALVTAYKEPGVSNFRNVIVFPKVGVA
jgi:hypothetical protein